MLIKEFNKMNSNKYLKKDSKLIQNRA